MAEPGGHNLGTYRILDKLGEGGMGVVYRAEDLRLRREVAIKVLPEEVAEDPERLQRFEREARVAGALNHPNVVTVHEIDTHEGKPFLVTELLEGSTLRQVIASGTLTLRKALEYGRQIANGLAAAHDKGVVHRDLKPENLFLTSDGHIKILDFGLAKLRQTTEDPPSEAPTATQQTLPGVTMGTAAYMSPEQVRAFPIDHRSDIFSLGVVMYEMVTGERPFEGPSPADVQAAILTKEPPTLSKAKSQVPAALEGLVTRCLEKRPEDRFSSASDLAFALEAVGQASPRDEKPRPRAPGRRWPYVLATILAAVVVALMVSWPGGLWPRIAPPPADVPIQSIAVLPLENLSGDPGREYFADGMTDELIMSLSRIGALDVISRTSAMRFKGSKLSLPEIAEELGVDAVVEGSVLRSGGEVRITVQLIHGATDRHLWAESYQRPLQDVLKLQGEVAGAVAHEINIALTPHEEQRLAGARQVDPEAHEAYLKGMHQFMLFTGEGMRRSMAFLETSIARDPEYAAAYAALGGVHLNSTYFLRRPPTQNLAVANSATDRALELDPESAAGFLNRAWIQFTYEWDWAAAERSHRRALELSPSWAPTHNNYAYMLACLGRFDDAVVHARRAEQLDPFSPVIGQNAGMVLYLARRYEEAIAQLEKTIEKNPTFWFAHQRLAMVLQATGDYARGLEVIEKGMSLAGPGTPRDGREVYAQLLATSGRRQEAMAILRELEEIGREQYVPPSDIARVYAGLGDADEAFRWLDEAIKVRDGDLFMLGVWPIWDRLRPDPRFGTLLRRVNLPEG